VGFSRMQQRERIERFTSFMSKRGLVTQQIHTQEKGGYPFIVASETELVMVLFQYNGGVLVTGSEGLLKESILTWIGREGYRTYDRTTPSDLAKLSPFRYLLKPREAPAPDLDAVPPPGALQLAAQDNPLVELTQLLGYAVYLLAASEEPPQPRYAIASRQKIVAKGNHLAHMLAQLITGQSVSDSEEASTPLPSRNKLYLPETSKEPLAYWRIETKMPDGSLLTQHKLAELAHLNVKTVRKIEEKQEPDPAHVYLSTAWTILKVLNNLRDLQKLPLLQQGNVIWKLDGLDET
jgi:hypothetical protein